MLLHNAVCCNVYNILSISYFSWIRLQGTPDTILERGRDARLVIDNVTYDHQGEYVCKVSNVIAGSQRAVQSEPIAVQVVGKCIS